MVVCGRLFAADGQKLSEDVQLYRRLLMRKMFAGALSQGLGSNMTGEVLLGSYEEGRWSFQGTNFKIDE